MFRVRSFEENQRDPITRAAQQSYDRSLSQRRSSRRMTASESAMARARSRAPSPRYATPHQGVTRRSVVDEARARAQQRVQDRSRAAADAIDRRRYGRSEPLSPSEMARMRAQARSRSRSRSTSPRRRSLEEARQMATARVRSRASAAAENVRRSPSPRRGTERTTETPSQRAMRLARESRVRSPSPSRRGRGRPTSSSRGRGSNTGRGRGRPTSSSRGKR